LILVASGLSDVHAQKRKKEKALKQKSREISGAGNETPASPGSDNYFDRRPKNKPPKQKNSHKKENKKESKKAQSHGGAMKQQRRELQYKYMSNEAHRHKGDMKQAKQAGKPDGSDFSGNITGNPAKFK